jgi:Tol biopolymer transport system component
MLAVAALAVVWVGLWAVPAGAQYFGQNKIQYDLYRWRSISSDHFEVYFYDGSDSLAMRALDLAEKTNAVFSKRLGHSLSRRIPIILYGSHNDFSQTNTLPDLIDGSTGGFTEPLRDRVVIPFTGSYEDFRHVLVHELTHAFQFDILYNGTGMSLLSGQGFFSMPLWFAEGMAEYFSLGIESNAEMWCRDGALAGYIPPLGAMGGYPVYKFGQSAIAFLTERYGEERFRDVLKRARQMRSFDRAFERTYGMSVGKFDEKWHQYLRKRYWPTVAAHELPEVYGRRLTDHRKDQSNINTAPAVSPQGDRIAYYSDRRQYTDVYVMSAFDGRVLRRVIRGERSPQFESMPLFRSEITWSPDGTRLAITAKSRGRDRLYVIDARSGKVERDFALPCDALAFPAWSPVNDSIAVTGLKAGRSDLYLVHARTGEVTRLTDDTWDEKEPTWTPDGRHLTFASDRGTPVVLQPERVPGGYGHDGLYDLEVATRQITRVLDTSGEDHSPAWSPDGRRLAFISDRDGPPNIYLYDPADRTITQLTDVLGGVQDLSWSRQNDRLVFSAFDRLGWDIFAVQEPLSNDGVMLRLRRQNPAAVVSLEAAGQPGASDSLAIHARGALAAAWPDSASVPDSALGALSRRPLGPRVALPPVSGEPPAWEGTGGTGAMGGMNVNGMGTLVAPDTSSGLPERHPLVERGGPFALADSVLAQTAEPYHWKLGAESANGGFAAATGYGFIGSTSLLFSDFLGDRNLYIATDVFPGSLEETNALAIFSYLPRRWDWSAGAFHFKNYFQSRVTTLGEQLSSAQVFSERTFGALAQASYPFDRFRRIDAGFTQMFVERTFYVRDVYGDYVRGPRTYRSVTSPSISLVGDNSLSSYYGPVNGSRFNLTYSPSVGLFSKSLEYQTLSFDFRRYWDLTNNYTFAFRTLDAGSWGRDPQAFRVGGFSTLRGYPDYDVIGSRIAIVNAELRFPFIQQLGLVGPVPIGNFNLRGAVFSDAGLVWNDGDPLRLTTTDVNGRHLASPRLAFGTGVRSLVLFALLKLDVAWKTDLNYVSRPRWHFSIGQEF